MRKQGILSEVILWKELEKDKLGVRFLRQRPIAEYIVDFYCPKLKLAIEIDGSASHDSKLQYDKSRQKTLEGLGIRVLRFRDSDVHNNLGAVVLEIENEILRSAKGGPPPLEKEE